MIAIMLIIPIVLYIILIVFIFKRIYKNKNIIIKSMLFIFVVTLPFYDQIIGYYIFKDLCKNNGGIKIFKTIIDKEEQESYWITKGIDSKARNYSIDKIFHYNLGYRQYLSNDFTKVYNFYFPIFYQYNKEKNKEKIFKEVKKYFEINKKSDSSIFIDGKEINEKIQSIKKTPYYFKRSFKNGLSYVDDSRLSLVNTILNKKNKIEIVRGYLNYCKEKYNELPTYNINYKKSCNYADKIIKKYNLQYIKKVIPNKYRFYNSYFDKKYTPETISFLNILVYTNKIYNKNDTKLLAIEKIYGFKSGWYLQMASYLFSDRNEIKTCPKRMNSNDFQELVIPNPFKQKK